MGKREIFVYSVVGEFFEENKSDIWSGFLKLKGEKQLSLTDFLRGEGITPDNTYRFIEKLLSAVADNIDLYSVARYQHEALPIFETLLESKRMWKKRKVRFEEQSDYEKVSLMLSDIWSLVDESIKQSKLISGKLMRASFSVFLILFYLTRFKEKTPKVSVARPKAKDVYWVLGNPPYEIEDNEPYIVVNLMNFEPKIKIDWLDEIPDRNGAIYDIIFSSALLSALESRIIPITEQDYNTIYKIIPGKIRGITVSTSDNPDFEELFTAYQRLFVEHYDEFSKDLRMLTDTFTHIITLMFNIPVTKTEIVRPTGGDPRDIASIEKLIAQPGTYWVFGNPVAYVSTGNREIIANTIKLKDKLLFKHRDYGSSPLLTIHKIGLMKIFRDSRAVQRDYLMLIRVHAVEKSKKEESEENPFKEVRYVNELLSAIPVSPEVVIKRAGLSEKASVERVRDVFFLNDEPASSKDVLFSLYLLGRAFVPKYALYDPEEYTILGLDQYNALLSSVLTYLSPTYSLAELGMDYDSRIHMILYGVKGIGKTKLLEFYDRWGFNIFYFSAITKPTEAGFIGGVSTVEEGKKKIRAFKPGNIVRADGGMLMVDEIDSLRDSQKRSIVESIAQIMSSGYAPVRQIMSDTGIPRMRVYASFLGAANPIGGKEGKYIEEALVAMYLLHPEILGNYLQLTPETLRAVLKKIIDSESGVNIEDVLNGRVKLEGNALRDEFKYLASSTPYDFYVIDFVKHPVFTKFADRLDFIVPMYTKVINIDRQFMKSGFTVDGRVVIYDKKLDGKMEVERRDLMSFVAEIQTSTPLFSGASTELLDELKLTAIDLAKGILKSYDLTTANKVMNITDAIDAVRVLSRVTSAREFNIAYKVLHTLLKLYDMDSPNKAIEDAVRELILMKYKLLYENPLGITLIRDNLISYLNAVLMRALSNTREINGKVYYYVPKKDLPAHIQTVLHGRVVTLDVGRVTKIVPMNTAMELAVNMFKILAGEDLPQGTAPGILTYMEIDGEPCYATEYDPDQIAQMLVISYGRCGEKECNVKLRIGNVEYKLGTIRWSE